MTGALSPSHWVIVLVVVLLLFGAKRLPDAARGLGRSMRILRAETTAMSDDDPKTRQSRAGGVAAPASTAVAGAVPAAGDTARDHLGVGQPPGLRHRVLSLGLRRASW